MWFRVHVSPSGQGHNTSLALTMGWNIEDQQGRCRRFDAACWCLPVFQNHPDRTIIVHRDNAFGDVREP